MRIDTLWGVHAGKSGAAEDLFFSERVSLPSHGRSSGIWRNLRVNEKRSQIVIEKPMGPTLRNVQLRLPLD